jgi:hypothetical protein
MHHQNQWLQATGFVSYRKTILYPVAVAEKSRMDLFSDSIGNAVALSFIRQVRNHAI